MGHRLGQVFLKDKNIIQKIVHLSGVQKNYTVVEIGCGEGILTEALTGQCRKLYVMEIDPHYLEFTKEKVSDQTNFLEGDVLELGFDGIAEKKFHIIANIPYYISAKLLKLLILNRERLTSATLMVQKEFAQKLIAPAGAKLYGSFTVYCRYFFDIQYLFSVSRNSFWPKPNVDSAVIQIKPKPLLPLAPNDAENLFKIVRSSFWARRKNLKNCLTKSPYLQLPSAIFTTPALAPYALKRGEDLTLDDFQELYAQIGKVGNFF